MKRVAGEEDETIVERLDQREDDGGTVVRFDARIVQQQVPAGKPLRLVMKIISVAELARTGPPLCIVTMYL